ncbi:MAG: prolipoprotein diacylglyceryl transferase [Candidatus Nanoarchaeia archaeon]|nr:prolipoprotein diacylglyceryl transferase [Candidatus Nanoarchaeia archaeon]
MFIHNLDPVLLTIFGLEVRYYGLIYVISFIIAYFLLKKLSKENDLNLKVDDFLFYVVIGAIIGARLFYVIFYNFSYFWANPVEIVILWRGGLSFHGGLVGAVIAGLIYSKVKKINFWKLADISVIPLAIGLFLGRIGNFINGELYGRITNVPWAVKFPNAEGYRHPSQIYESLKNLFIFFILWFNRKSKHKAGFNFALFMLLYSVLRFIIEFFRAPDQNIGFICGLTMGQLLNIPLFLISLYLLIKKIK